MENKPAGTVQFRTKDVVHHAASVADLEATRLYSTDSSRPNDGNAFLVGQFDQLASVVLRYSFSDDGDRADLGRISSMLTLVLRT